MGFFRFRKSIKVLPGVRMNLSKSGVSTSLGGSGVTLNLSKRGTRATYSAIGAGLSYVETRPPAKGGTLPSGGSSKSRGAAWALGIVLLLCLAWAMH
jgi:hypothetical protein